MPQIGMSGRPAAFTSAVMSSSGTPRAASLSTSKSDIAVGRLGQFWLTGESKLVSAVRQLAL